MLLGGTVAGSWTTPEEWEALLVRSRFKAVTAPFDCQTERETIAALRRACDRHGVAIAEIGVWKNLFDPDPARAAMAMEYAKGQLALADEAGIPCCVNIAGTASAAGWDAADPDNYRPETYRRIVESIREIIDAVRPTRACYCLEPMPWMVPDGPDEYLQLIRDVDRPQFAAHMDFVNMINCPPRYFNSDDFLQECFDKLGPLVTSCHLKDIVLNQELTFQLVETYCGNGSLNIEKYMTLIDQYDKDMPVIIEHLTTDEEYRSSLKYVQERLTKAGISY